MAARHYALLTATLLLGLWGCSLQATATGGAVTETSILPPVSGLRDTADDALAPPKPLPDFWNTFQAMGGEGSFARWQRQKPALGSSDRVHPTPNGAEKIGRWLTAALVGAARTHEGSASRAPVAAREGGAAP